MTAREAITKHHAWVMSEIQQFSNDALLSMDSVDRTVVIEDREVREYVWRDNRGVEPRIIVQHHDERAARMWADGFAIASDGSRRPLTEFERREYD